MNFKKYLLLAAVVFALHSAVAPARAQSYGPFFAQEQFVGYDGSGYAVFYLPYFGYYTYLGFSPSATPYPGYLYKYNFGFLYSFGGSGGGYPDVYLYDFGQQQNLGYLYTSAYYGSDANNYFYFYSYDFRSNEVYYQNTFNPRYFYEYATGQYFTRY